MRDGWRGMRCGWGVWVSWRRWGCVLGLGVGWVVVGVVGIVGVAGVVGYGYGE